MVALLRSSCRAAAAAAIATSAAASRGTAIAAAAAIPTTNSAVIFAVRRRPRLRAESRAQRGRVGRRVSGHGLWGRVAVDRIHEQRKDHAREETPPHRSGEPPPEMVQNVFKLGEGGAADLGVK